MELRAHLKNRLVSMMSSQMLKKLQETHSFHWSPSELALPEGAKIYLGDLSIVDEKGAHHARIYYL